MFADLQGQRASTDFLSIADYAVQLIAVAYGVFATAVDFKVEKNGQKRLSRTGILGLAFLFITSLAAIQIKVWKDHRDEKARDAQKAVQDQANANIARNVEMSRSLLAGLSRMQDPVEGNFTLFMILKLAPRPFDQADTQTARSAKERKSPMEGLAANIRITDRTASSLFSTASFTSKCSTALLTVKVKDATLSCVGPSTALLIGEPKTYADLDGSPVDLQVRFDDPSFDIATPVVTLTGTRKTFRFEELTRLKTCEEHLACFRGTLRVSQL